MKIKNWVGLLVLYVSYLCLGGFAFNKLECPNSMVIRKEKWATQVSMERDLKHFRLSLNHTQISEFQQILDNYFEFSNVTEFVDKCLKWDFYNSIFFSFTAVTTIGYGHQAPNTNDGRTFCVFYSLLGIPLNALLIGAMGNIFSDKMSQLKSKAKSRGLGKTGKVFLEGTVFLIILTLVFLIIPAAVFASLEDEASKDWEFVDCIYYAFITLSTIGFGDLVAGRNNQNEVMRNNVSKMMYQIGIIVWIILGMGYIVGVVNVLAQSLASTSKPIKRVFHHMKNHVQVQDYWRKILAELVQLKHGEGWSDENLLDDGAGGGSEPNLGHLVISSGVGEKRRAASTGDLETVGDNREDNLEPPNKSKEQSLQKLDHDNDMLADIEELNEDTITSLKHFLMTSRAISSNANTVVARSSTDTFATWLANNVPDSGMSLPPTRPITRNNSEKINHNTVQPGSSRGTRWQSVHNPKRSRRSDLARQGSVTSQKSLPSVPATVSLLENTSLAEFLTAVEMVRVKSEAEIQATVAAEEDRKRKPSVLRKLSTKLSMGTNHPGEQDTGSTSGPLTLNQVTNLLNIQARCTDDTVSQASDLALVRSPSSKSTNTQNSFLDIPSPYKNVGGSLRMKDESNNTELNDVFVLQTTKAMAPIRNESI